MVEIRPDIFVRRSEIGDFWEVSRLPSGYQIPGVPMTEQVVFTVGDVNFCQDPIVGILYETCQQLFWSGNILSPEGEKAKAEYLQYTGFEWDSHQFIKR